VPDESNSTVTRAEDERILRGLREEIGARVRPFVAHLDPGGVEELIAQMARIRFKYDGAGSLRRASNVAARPLEE